MLTRNNALTEQIKQEVLAEMEAGEDFFEPGHYRQPMYGRGFRSPEVSGDGSAHARRVSPADIGRIKREILLDLQDELAEQQYHGAGYYRVSPALSPYDRAVVESVKNELLAGLEARQAARYAGMYGYGNLVSDRNLNKMIDQRYRTLQDIRNDLRRELESLRDIESRGISSSDPHVRSAAGAIAAEAREQGFSLDEVLRKLNGNGAMKTGWLQRMSNLLNTGQRKGFVYGVGATILAAMLFPPVKESMRSVAVRTMEGGMELADRARTMVSRAKEEIEDIVAEANFKNMQDRSIEDMNTLEE